MRCTRPSVIASSRSSERARCAPRLVGTTACISSMITVSTWRKLAEASEVSSRYSDSGVVIRISAGWRRKWLRSFCGCVTGTDTDLRLVEIDPCLAGHICDPSERRAQVAFHIHSQSFERADINDPATLGIVSLRCNMSRSRHQRNAVSVLPVPVGARIRVFSPRAIAGQPSRCGAVGCSKTARNQAAVTGWKRDSASSSGAVVAGRVGFFAAIGAASRIAAREG